MAGGRYPGRARLANVVTEVAQHETPAGERIRVGIVDDHPVLRDGLASLLNGEPDLKVVATGETSSDAVRLLATPDIDVLILDVRLGQASGFEPLGD